MYSGYVNVEDKKGNNLFYWFTEADEGSENKDTPLILWMNGGPGASSSIGLLTENIGLYTVTDHGTMEWNKDSWTKIGHVIIFDNPVGAGYSYTDSDAYVNSEVEMAEQLVQGIKEFFKLHPEYSKNKFYLAGESYAGKYIPNIAYYILKNETKDTINLSGVIMGNGLYDAKLQYGTIAWYAYSHGLIDDQMLAKMTAAFQKCIDLIKQNKLVEAADYCEGKVSYLYDDLTKAFRYDIKYFSNILGDIDKKILSWINLPDVKEALHVKPDAKWLDADETGPVAEHLKADFMVSVVSEMEYILDQGIPVLMYNGERDGSACNHMGNRKVAEALDWVGAKEFEESTQYNFLDDNKLTVGFAKKAKNFSYVTLVNTGHLVSMFEPEVANLMISKWIKEEL